jgi:ATP/maltotriose-dependent transcriptional regulator MalT
MISHLCLATALALDNQAEAAREVLRSARKIAQKASPWHLENVEVAKLEIYLDSDPQDAAQVQQEVARRQAEGLKMDEDIARRVLLKQNRPAEALALLEHAVIDAGMLPTYRNVRILALTAMAYFQKKDLARALATLEKTLKFAEPENRVASFVREGAAMEKLLRFAQGKTAEQAFVRRVLAAFESRNKAKPGPAPTAETLIEPLSERELEVLQQLNSYLSTPEIASLLVVSANTVRTHIKNIYAKLDVHGRSGAVRRARELGLLVK